MDFYTNILVFVVTIPDLIYLKHYFYLLQGKEFIGVPQCQSVAQFYCVVPT